MKSGRDVRQWVRLSWLHTHRDNRLWQSLMLLAYKIINLKSIVTCTKSILWHLVPLVNVLKDAVPSSTPEGAVRKAIQLTTKDPFVPGPDSNTQTRKLYCVTSAVQTTAESWTLTVSPSLWTVDAKTRIFAELENARGYWTMLQWRKPCDALVTFAFPLCQRVCPERKKNNFRDGRASALQNGTALKMF